MAELIRETELFGTDIPRLEGLRDKGRAAFRLPTPKTEAWKYTRLHVLKNGDFVPPASKFLAELSGSSAWRGFVIWHRMSCLPFWDRSVWQIRCAAIPTVRFF